MLQIMALFLLFLTSCKKAAAPEQRTPPVPVIAQAVTTASIPVYENAFGTLVSPHSINLTAQVNGQIIDVPVQEGQYVHAGDLIVQIDPRTYQANLDNAIATLQKDEASLRFAQENVEAYAKLLPQDFVAKITYEQHLSQLQSAEATVSADKANIATAEVNLGYTRILAPVDGVISLLDVDPYNFVNQGSSDAKVATLEQIQPIDATFAVPESLLYRLRKQSADGPIQIVASFLGQEQRIMEGRLFAINNTVDTTTGTVMLKARFGNEDLSAWPGQYINIRLLMDTLPHATIVPAVAVQVGQSGTFVFLIEPNNTVTTRYITISHWYGDFAVIGEGVSPGQLVVIDGQLNLYSGAPIKVLKVQK